MEMEHNPPLLISSVAEACALIGVTSKARILCAVENEKRAKDICHAFPVKLSYEVMPDIFYAYHERWVLLNETSGSAISSSGDGRARVEHYTPKK